MVKQIDYFFFSASPFAYLGHGAICSVARKHGVILRPRPVNLASVWAESGSVPLSQRPPLRQRYRLLELERIALWRDMPINPQPKYFPVDPTLADKCVIALTSKGADVLPIMAAIFKSIWVDEKDISDESLLTTTLIQQHGHDAHAVLAHAKSDEAEAMRQANTDDAKAADAVGVPAYVVGGEVFWGQDRIELIDHMLETGRSPIVWPRDS